MTEQAFNDKKAIRYILSPVKRGGESAEKKEVRYDLAQIVRSKRLGVQTQMDYDSLLAIAEGLENGDLQMHQLQMFALLETEVNKLRTDSFRYLLEERVRLALSLQKNGEYQELSRVVGGIRALVSHRQSDAPSFKASTGILALLLKNLRTESSLHRSSANVLNLSEERPGLKEQQKDLGYALRLIINKRPDHASWIITTLLDEAKEAFVRAGRAATESEGKNVMGHCFRTLHFTDNHVLLLFNKPVLSLDEAYNLLMKKGSPGAHAGIFGEAARRLFDKMYKNGIATNQKPLVSSALVWRPKPASQPHMPQ